MFTAFIAGFSFIIVDGNCSDNLRRTKSFTQYTSRPHIDPKQKFHRSESMPNLHNNYNIDDDSEDDDFSFLNIDIYNSEETNKDNFPQNNMNHNNNISPIELTKSEDYSSSSNKYSSDSDSNSNRNFVGKKRYRDINNNYDLEDSDSDYISYIDYPDTPSSERSHKSGKNKDCYYPEDFDN